MKLLKNSDTSDSFVWNSVIDISLILYLSKQYLSLWVEKYDFKVFYTILMSKVSNWQGPSLKKEEEKRNP